jgi:hypothetical protein
LKRARLFLVAALAAGALGLTASPAAACQPEYCPECGIEPVDTFWRKHFGHDLSSCPWG